MYQLSTDNTKSSINRNLIVLVSVVVCGYFASHVLFTYIWIKNNYFIHNFLELFSLFLMLFSFLHVWNTYSETNPFVQLAGLGSLTMVAINLPHIVNFADMIDMPYEIAHSLMDISLKYGVLIALFEALIWLVLGFSRRNCAINKWLGLTLSLGVAALFLAASVVITYNIPAFYKSLGTTIDKRQWDFILPFIALPVIALYRVKYKNSIDDREKVVCKYIILALCLFIPARICFAFSLGVTSTEHFFGHILKLAYYYFIYYGVYKATIEYPYKQVRKIRDFYGRLLDTSPVGIMTFDSEQKINYTSKMCDSLFRYDMKNLNGITLEQFLGSVELLEYSKPELLEKLMNPRWESITFYGRPAFTNDKVGKLIFSATQQPMGIAFAIRDAKKAQAIENMQLQTQTILDSTDNIVFIVDMNKKVVMCNKKFCQITDIRSSDIVGLSLMELANLLQSDFDSQKHMHIESNGVMRGIAWIIRTRNGELKKISLDSSKIYDVDNEMIGSIVIGRDITEFEREQEKIIHGEKMAIIGQMAAGLVHEIKNPLASIKGLCQLMRSRVKPEKIPEYAAVMENAVDDIGEIVSDFLQFSRPATGDYRRASINSLLKSLEMLISSNAYKHGIMTQFFYSDTELPVLLNSQQIKNIILGMVDNAIEAMNGAIDPRLLITTQHDKPKNEMRISIKDNGIGMTEEQLKYICTPFYTTKPKGTGLGLSICKYVIDEHGGGLKIESKFGEGAVFTITLPCAADE